MFTKQNLLASLAGFLVMFFLGYAIWDFATEKKMNDIP